MMPKARLICLPFAGGSKYSYLDFAKKVDSRIETEAVDYPGRGLRSKEKLITDWRTLVDDIFEQMKDLTDVPYVIWGHSMGAWLGLLLIHKLQAEGIPTPVMLVASGRNGPSHIDPHRDRIHLLPRDEFIEKLKELGGSSPEVLENEMLMQLFEPILRADFSVLDSYTHEPLAPLDIPIKVLYGDGEKDVNAEGLETWKQESTLKVDIREYPGNHFFIFDHADDIARMVAEALLNT